MNWCHVRRIRKAGSERQDKNRPQTDTPAKFNLFTAKLGGWRIMATDRSHDKAVACLFDVDGTLTAPRQVCSYTF